MLSPKRSAWLRSDAAKVRLAQIALAAALFGALSKGVEFLIKLLELAGA